MESLLLYIYLEETLKMPHPNPPKLKRILNVGIKIDKEGLKKKFGSKFTDNDIFERIKIEYPEKILKEVYEEGNKADPDIACLQNLLELLKIEIVMLKESKTFKGAYYAHEYEAFTAGQVEIKVYSNGYQENIVSCLNDDFDVADGVWDHWGENGSGDKFLPNEEIPERFGKEKENEEIQG